MAQRLSYRDASPEVVQAMWGLEKALKNSGLELSLIELVRLRASQINGCAFCINMHTRDMRAEGETEQRIYLLNAWRDAPFYSDRERAALEWTEALTLVSETHVPDEIYGRVQPHFTKQELVNLTLAVVAINGWNRFAIAFRSDLN